MQELNSKDIFIVDSSNEAAKSLMLKLAGNAKSGAIIFITNEEFKCLESGVIRMVLPQSSCCCLAEPLTTVECPECKSNGDITYIGFIDNQMKYSSGCCNAKWGVPI